VLLSKRGNKTGPQKLKNRSLNRKLGVSWDWIVDENISFAKAESPAGM
jgi:hypothetical protein